MQIEFVKMHGLGNDFVIVQKSTELASLDLNKLVKKISDRRLGLGSDQFILYEGSACEYSMFIFNQDGSRAGACGNATRCLAKLANEITINVSGRKLRCIMNDDGDVSVNMGKASFSEAWMPKESKLWEIAALYKLEPREILCVEVGNPHLVILKADLSHEDQELIGKNLEHHTLFPDGVNVNFASVKNQEIRLKVWERGAGFTLACGTGACASFAAAKKLGFIDDEALVKFALGNLKMLMDGGDIVMTGKAELVARGSYYYDE
jgi:diaminopimelate epimerase